MSEWQPIETALIVTDVFLTEIPDCLVYSPQFGIKVGRAWRYPDGDVHASAAGFHGDWLITHWMPLPDPPTD